jgi:hypothetical protein
MGPGVEVCLALNIMNGISMFPFQLLGSFKKKFLTSKLDVQCMVIAKKEQTQFCFQTFLN